MEIQTQAKGDPQRDPHCCAFLREGMRSETHLLPIAPPESSSTLFTESLCCKKSSFNGCGKSKQDARDLKWWNVGYQL